MPRRSMATARQLLERCLARRGAVEGVDEDEHSRRLVTRELRTAPRLQFGVVDVVVLGHLHERDNLLAEPWVRHAQHHAVEHALVLAQHHLDLVGIDLLPSGVDRCRPTAEQPHGAVDVDRRIITRNRVPLAVEHAPRGRGPLGILVVADREVTAHRHEPDFFRAGCDVAPGVLIDDPDAVADAEPRRLDRLVVGARGAARPEPLRRAEGVDDAEAGHVREQPALGVGAEQHAGRRDAPQAAEVPAARLRVECGEQWLGEHVADDREVGDALALDGVPHQLRVQTGAVDQHHRATARERRQREVHARPVHQRGDREQHPRALCHPSRPRRDRAARVASGATPPTDRRTGPRCAT